MSTINVATIKSLSSSAPVFQTTSGASAGTLVSGSIQTAKAWAAYNQGTINDSFNVSSINDLGTGNYRINFSTSFANSNYCGVTTGGNGNNAPAGVAIMSKNAGNYEVFFTGLNVQINQAADSSLSCSAFFGDQ